MCFAGQLSSGKGSGFKVLAKAVSLDNDGRQVLFPNPSRQLTYIQDTKAVSLDSDI